MNFNLFVNDNEEKLRMLSILSYVIVLIGFGIPIWWQTTRVYRAPLPLDEMLEMKSMAAPPLFVSVQATTEAKTNLLIEEIQSILGPSISISSFPHPIPLPSSSNSIHITPSPRHSPQPYHILLKEWPNASQDIVYSPHRTIYFHSNVNGAKLATLLSRWPGTGPVTALAHAQSGAETQLAEAFPAASKYDVLVTVVDPDGRKLDWNVVEAINEYVKPYLQSLSTVANFTVKSQWLYFVDLGVNPRQVGDHWALAEQLLPHIITPLEKKLASHVSKNICINLVVYVASCQMAPIYIYTKTGVRSPGKIPAFISPRWGGLQIINPDCLAPTFAPDTALVMSTIVTQLGKLLGIPGTAPNGAIHTNGLPSQWQVDFLIRGRILEYLDSARLTLRSLAQLLSEISNIVINDDVAADVQLAVTNIAQAEQFLKEKNVPEAFKCAEIAAGAAESAFTDPSLLALLYFPDDQKYAVYIPLFLPIMIPVIMSMWQLLQYVKKKKSKYLCK